MKLLCVLGEGCYGENRQRWDGTQDLLHARQVNPSSSRVQVKFKLNFKMFEIQSERELLKSLHDVLKRHRQVVAMISRPS